LVWTFDSDQPIYTQLVDRIKFAIVSGELKPGDRMSAVRELALEAGVNPNTMQRAMAQLEADGLLITNRTQGRTVTDQPFALDEMRRQLAETHIENYFQEMKALGFDRDAAVKLLGEKGTNNE
jgi:DNA-binding transcriptional regulator YhcF (GntR family)